MCAGHTHTTHHRTEVLPVTITLEQAKQRFNDHHSANVLAPASLLAEDPHHEVRLAYLPFWLFTAQLSTQFSASVGHTIPGTSPPHTKWTRSTTRHHVALIDRWQPLSQVYAAYTDRRDLAEGLKPVIQEQAAYLQLLAGAGAHARHGQHLSQHATQHDRIREMALGQEVEVQAVEMRQSIAWELALRATRLAEVCLSPGFIQTTTSFMVHLLWQ